MRLSFVILAGAAVVGSGVAAQTMQAPTMGKMTPLEVGVEPMMRISPSTYVALLREAARSEQAAGRIALRRSRRPAVRAFASTIVHDQGAALAELSRIAGPERLSGADRAAVPKDLVALTRAPADRFDQLFLDQQLDAHKHLWALHAGQSADGLEPRLRALAMRSVAIEEAHLRRLPMRPMPY